MYDMSDILRPLILELDNLDDHNQGAVIVQRIKELLAAGVDPNGEDQDGLTPLMRVVDLRKSGRAFQTELVRMLMAHDANPLVNDIPIAHTEGFTVGLVIGQELSRAEHLEKPVRADDGGNTFHVLAQKDIGLLYAILCENYNTREETNFPRVWLNEKRFSDGATPLHILWGKTGILASFVAEKQDISAQSEEAWEATMLMAEEGADLLAMDSQGRRVIDLMSERVGEGIEVSSNAQKFWGERSSAANKLCLEENTPLAYRQQKQRRI